MHTPGPWHAKAPNAVNLNWWVERRAGGRKSLICETTNCLGHGGTAEANARLIAAAPDMLAALERCELALNAGRAAVDTALREEVLAKVRAVLGKARASQHAGEQVA